MALVGQQLYQRSSEGVRMIEKKNPTTREEELRSFVFLTMVMAPILAGLIIAGYGFMVWMYQMFAGPPHA